MYQDTWHGEDILDEDMEDLEEDEDCDDCVFCPGCQALNAMEDGEGVGDDDESRIDEGTSRSQPPDRVKENFERRQAEQPKTAGTDIGND